MKSSTAITTFTTFVVLLVLGASTLAQGKKYALVVGVERYDPTQLTSLDYAEDDAQEIAASLEKLGFDVVVMVSQTPIPERQPVLAQDILNQLDRRVKKCDEEDMLLVSLSGHGVQLKSDPIGADGSKETYFCPQRATLGDKRSLLPMSAVTERISACKAGRKVLLLDACRNEVEPKEVKNKSVEIELDPAGVTRRTAPRGTVAIFSCSSKERSFEIASLGHSVFSYHVIRYLKGQADPTRYPRQELSVSELATYVARETRDYVDSRLNKDQTPELLFLEKSSLSDWSLGKLDGEAKIFTSRTTGMELILIKAGSFDMGSPANEVGRSDDERQHRVTLTRDYYMGKYEVTQADFRHVMGFNPSYFSSTGRGSVKVRGENTNKLPVEEITWYDAVMFCNKLSELDSRTAAYSISNIRKDGDIIQSATINFNRTANGYRLPTEAEWEYACRAGTNTPFSSGAQITPDQANYEGNYPYAKGAKGLYRGRTVAVDSMSFPNRFGLFHMHGNVWEWCWDNYDKDYSNENGTSTDPIGPTTGSGRMRRGGGWGDNAAFLRSAFRSRGSPGNRNSYVGFRIASNP